VGVLMEFGADPCSRNLFGKTPIQLASPPIQDLIHQYLEVREATCCASQRPHTESSNVNVDVCSCSRIPRSWIRSRLLHGTRKTRERTTECPSQV
jgi:hypothetical protein